MSIEIVMDICPPPVWNLTAEAIHEMVKAMEETYQIYRPAFERSDQIYSLVRRLQSTNNSYINLSEKTNSISIQTDIVTSDGTVMHN